MSELIRVFTKDARRMWVPLAALAALLILADVLEVRRHFEPNYNTRQVLDLLTTVALPLAWMAVIAGAVLQDAVVGERQDWLTRPIARWQMLGAKVLFVLVFVSGFWFVSDCVILWALGLRVPVLELVLRQAPMTVLLFLPAICLATLVANVGQFALGLLMSALGMLLELIIWSPQGTILVRKEQVTLWIGLALLSSASIICGFLRYPKVVACLLFGIAVLLVPLGVPEHGYEMGPGSSLAMTPELSADQLSQFRISFDFGSRRLFPDLNFGHFGLPVKLEGLPDGVEVHGRGPLLVGITGGGQEARFATLHHDADGYWLLVNGTVPERLSNVSVDLSVDLFRTKPTKTVRMREGKVFSPADGFVCHGNMGGFFCWHAPEFEHSEMLLMTAYSSKDSETPGGFPPGDRYLPAGFSPVVEQIMSLSAQHKWEEVRFSVESWVGAVNRSLTADPAELKQ